MVGGKLDELIAEIGRVDRLAERGGDTAEPHLMDERLVSGNIEYQRLTIYAKYPCGCE